jgi:hypothetical protein
MELVWSEKEKNYSSEILAAGRQTETACGFGVRSRLSAYAFTPFSDSFPTLLACHFHLTINSTRGRHVLNVYNA